VKTTATHPYIGDGIKDHRGEDRCANGNCARPRSNPVHDLPPAPPQQQQHRERYGETDD
jgi:hypothetical protein